MKIPEVKLFTPEEFADKVLDGRRSARWVRERCAEYVRTRGESGIGVAFEWAGHYMIPESEALLFSVHPEHVAAARRLAHGPDGKRAAELKARAPRLFRVRGADSESRG